MYFKKTVHQRNCSSGDQLGPISSSFAIVTKRGSQRVSRKANGRWLSHWAMGHEVVVLKFSQKYDVT